MTSNIYLTSEIWCCNEKFKILMKKPNIIESRDYQCYHKVFSVRKKLLKGKKNLGIGFAMKETKFGE